MAGAGRDAALRERLTDAETLWDLACGLLQHWRARLPGQPARRANDERYDRWSDLEAIAQVHFSGRDAPDECGPGDVELLLRLTAEGDDADAVDALAWGLSKVTSHTFAPAWRDRIGTDRHRLAAGEPYPVADAPWDGHGRALSGRASSLSDCRIDELPWIRIHDESCVVTVDFSMARTLEALVSTLGEIVTCHPNEHWDELDFRRTGQRTFPIVPRNEARQRDIVTQLVERALARAPQAIVLPELSVTPEIVDELAPRLRDLDAPCLLVAGSFHRVRDGAAENVALGFVSGAEQPMEHRKCVPFTNELRPVAATKEGIDRIVPFEITVHQADRFRIALVICKELLVPEVRAHLDRMAVNVLFVPALSAKTTDFRNAVAARAMGAQALTVVANGPLRDERGEPLQPAVVVGRPLQDEPRCIHVDPAGPTIHPVNPFA